MDGKVCIVTGANAGIGRATAQGLAALGATVILVARNKQSGEEARAAIQHATGNPSVVLMVADLSSQQQVRDLTAAILAQYPALHVLVNNAAFVPPTPTFTVDGLETQLATNHLAYFMLACLLVERMKASAPARIINVTSNLHARGRLDFDDLGGLRTYGAWGWGQYSNTKLMNILFTRELARRLVGKGITANAAHPGLIGTYLTRGSMPRFVNALYRLVLPGPEVGARTSIYLASSPEVAEVTGRYFVNSREQPPAALAQDDTLARRLWDESARLTGITI